MSDTNLQHIVALHLRELERDGSGEFDDDYARTTPGMSDVLALDGSIADRLSLLTALTALKDDGYVTERVTNVEGLSGERTVYALTDDGRSEADEYRDRVASKTVTVHDEDGTRTAQLEDLVSRSFDRTLAGVLARLTADGTLSLACDLEPALVGRDRERDQLERTLTAAENGSFRRVFVCGPRGIGKTALADHAADRALERGFAVLDGRCIPDVDEPYFAVREALATDLLASPLEESWPSVDERDAYRTQRSTLFRRIEDAVCDLAEEQPLLIVLEDLHWADSATIELLSHLLDRFDDESIVFLGTVRSEGVTGDGVLAELVELDRTRDDDGDGVNGETEVDATETPVRQVTVSDPGVPITAWLDPLDREQTADVIEREVGYRGVPGAFVDAVYGLTGGNPLFVRECITHLLEDGAIEPRRGRYPDGVEAITLPDVVETAVERRVDALDEETRRVLEYAAVFGERAQIDTLVTGWDGPEPILRERLDVLVDGHYLERPSGTNGAGADEEIRFESTILREVVLAGIADGRRQRLHARVAKTLATAERTDDGIGRLSATIAHHWERAGAIETAYDYYVRAAEQATGVYAHDVATELYERALVLAHEHGAGDSLAVLEALTDVAYVVGDYEEIDRRVRYLREQTVDPELLRRTYRYQAQIRSDRGAYADAIECADRGLAVEDDAESFETCQLLGYKAWALLKRGDLEAAADVCDAERELAERLERPLLIGKAYQDLGQVARYRGDLATAIEHLETAVTAIEDDPDDNRRELGRCLNVLGTVYLTADEFDAGETALERSHEIATGIGDRECRLQALNNLGVLHTWRGEWDAARECYETQYEEAMELGDRRDLGYVHANLGTLEIETGTLSAALEHLETSLEIARETEMAYNVTARLLRLARLHTLRNELDVAVEYADEALDIATEREFDGMAADAKRQLGVIHRERGDLERALECHEASVEIASGLEGADAEIDARCALVRTLLHADRPDEALAQAERAVDLVPADGYRLLGAKATLAIGASSRALGDDRAEEALSAALETIRGRSNPLEFRVRCERGGLWRDRGEIERARDELEAALSIAESMESALLVNRAHELLERF